MSALIVAQRLTDDLATQGAIVKEFTRHRFTEAECEAASGQAETFLAGVDHAGGRTELAAILRAVKVAVDDVYLLRSAKKPPRGPKGVVTLISNVRSEPVHWLWRSWIPLGMLTVFDGDPGLGKSTITLDLVARLSRGRAMPDGTPGPEASGAVILSAEDDLARVIRPRLDLAGADVRRVATVHVEADGTRREITITPDELRHVERAGETVDARLVVVDPVVAFLPADVNAHRDQDVRRSLALLRDLAERTGMAVVAIRHLNKNVGGQAIYRGGGSIGIIGAARAGIMLAPDPDDPTGERLVLAVTKANLARRPPSLSLSVVGEPDRPPRVEWGEESSHTATTLLALPVDPEKRAEVEEQRGALAEAEDFLREVLANGPVPAVEVKRGARQAGISEITLKRAKRSLGGRAEMVGVAGDQHWEWSLPSQSHHPL